MVEHLSERSNVWCVVVVCGGRRTAAAAACCFATNVLRTASVWERWVWYDVLQLLLCQRLHTRYLVSSFYGGLFFMLGLGLGLVCIYHSLSPVFDVGVHLFFMWMSICGCPSVPKVATYSATPIKMWLLLVLRRRGCTRDMRLSLRSREGAYVAVID